jgi:hypothetical protein
MFARLGVRALLLLYLATNLAGCATPSLNSISITPNTLTFIGPGGNAQFTAIGTYQQGDHLPYQQNITKLVTWQSASTGIVAINSTGVATGVGFGEIQISATMEGYKGIVIAYATVTVCQPDPSNPGQCLSSSSSSTGP